MLKRVAYPTASPQHKGEVVYTIIRDQQIIFSGITWPGSTINFAEYIIEKIAFQEHVGLRSYRWFDLQTHLGYCGKKPGIFDFNELILEVNTILIRSWFPRPITQEVLDLFREYIGELGSEIKIWNPKEAKQAGYLPTDIHSPTPGKCFYFVSSHQRQQTLVSQLPLELRGVAARIVPPSIIDNKIIVDHDDYPDYLVMSKGNRYCVWRRDTSGDN